MLDDRMQALQHGESHDPFSVLGRHEHEQGVLIREFMPSAERAFIAGLSEMEQVPGSDFFELLVPFDLVKDLPSHYSLCWEEKHSGNSYQAVSPYDFAPVIADEDLYCFGEGRHHHAYRFLGAHPLQIDGISGVRFAVWAPNVKRVSVVGDFNGWNGLRHAMRSRGSGGVWELFIPGLQAGDLYKFELLTQQSQVLVKTDPYAQAMKLRPDTACKIHSLNSYQWSDEQWFADRSEWDWQSKPVSIYEVHLGSWRRTLNNEFLNYRHLADQLVEYVTTMNYTHVELMPVMEHPLDESWGYQVTGYFAATARFGSPDDLRYLIDLCHQNNIGVILDWVPGHFPKDDFALARFTGEATYEHPDPHRGEHKDWGTLIFDYGRNEVKNFLLANAVFWMEEFHVDGLRVDAVASMLYLDYSRNAGEWTPNQFGGRENLEAIAFMKELNEVVHSRFPGGLMIAEESTAWPGVSRPTWIDGLGFSMKWNMGWMNDTLSYFEEDPINRRYHHNKLTFTQLYAYSENFVLPLSHDEVVHMKRSLLEKMPGDVWQKFANLRLLFAWQMLHPGKKLLFMGGEFGQWIEWSQGQSLDWNLLEYDTHSGLQHMVADLNALYRDQDALHAQDFSYEGFEWLSCDDDEQSVLGFVRHGHGQHMICLFNFTPVSRHHYRVALPFMNEYEEVFNTDSRYYGGSDCGNLAIEAEERDWMGKPFSAEVSLPPLAAVVLTVKKNNEKD